MAQSRSQYYANLAEEEGEDAVHEELFGSGDSSSSDDSSGSGSSSNDSSSGDDGSGGGSLWDSVTDAADEATDAVETTVSSSTGDSSGDDSENLFDTVMDTVDSGPDIDLDEFTPDGSDSEAPSESSSGDDSSSGDSWVDTVMNAGSSLTGSIGAVGEAAAGDEEAIDETAQTAQQWLPWLENAAEQEEDQAASVDPRLVVGAIVVLVVLLAVSDGEVFA